jgi:hypothetical protein
VQDGEIVAPNGARTSYWAFANEGLLDRDVSAGAKVKGAAQRERVGESEPRRDLPAKVFGRARFVHDPRARGHAARPRAEAAVARARGS